MCEPATMPLRQVIKNIVVLSGAGISAPSGLGTFRSKDGMWSKFDLKEIATPQAFRENPDLVREFYNMRRKACKEAVPNMAHAAISKLQAAWHGKVGVVTQNIDDLHERAGTTDVVHMHGEIMRAKCEKCGSKWGIFEDMKSDDCCPNCSATAVRPDVVWFGEETYHLQRVNELVDQADLFVVIGSSGVVYPAAGLIDRAHWVGARVLRFDIEPSPSPTMDLLRRISHVTGDASFTVPQWVEEILRGQG